MKLISLRYLNSKWIPHVLYTWNQFFFPSRYTVSEIEEPEIGIRRRIWNLTRSPDGFMWQNHLIKMSYAGAFKDQCICLPRCMYGYTHIDIFKEKIYTLRVHVLEFFPRFVADCNTYQGGNHVPLELSPASFVTLYKSVCRYVCRYVGSKYVSLYLDICVGTYVCRCVSVYVCRCLYR
jgi:hypothetical protein